MKGNMKMDESWDMKDMKCMMCEDGFMVKSKKEDEVMEMVKMHYKNMHKEIPTEKDMKEMMKACSMEMKKWQ